MSIQSVHPKYTEFVEDWVVMRDTYSGERAVKAKGETYLPATKGMTLDGMASTKPGYEAYTSYKLRAVFHDYVKEGVEGYIGLLHQKPATIELPAALEPLRQNASAFGEPLDLLLRRINVEQLITGRAGLLLDMPVNPDPANPMPYIALYIAEAIRNWDDGEAEEGESRLNLVVLDESTYKRTNQFEWVIYNKFRVLILGDIEENELRGTYQAGVFTDSDNFGAFDPSVMFTPTLRGKTLTTIPFVFVNTKDIVPCPDEPPLLGLAKLSLAIYRGEADYRQNLFMQGQDTLVVIGSRAMNDATKPDAPLRTGAGSYLEVEAGGDAKYIGVNSKGLPEQRQCLQADCKRAEVKAAQLINSGRNDIESGVALKTRISAQTATLNQIAKSGAAALEKILKMAAEWVGANPDEVVVTPNLEFADYTLTGKELVDFMTGRALGAPLSNQSIHALLVDRGITQMEYEEEVAKVKEENAKMPATLLQGDGIASRAVGPLKRAAGDD